MFRRTRPSAELTSAFVAFHAVLDQLEPAKAALTEVMPTTRSSGRTLPDALLDFERGLEWSQPLMPAWRVSEVEPQWIACDAGLDEARVRAQRLREEAPDVGGFEGLIWVVEHLLAPLEPFAAADDRFREVGAR